jgi:Flp pilus assembly protein TadD
LGKVLARQGRNAEALAVYERAVEIEPGDPHIHQALVLLRRRLGAD